MTASEIKNLLIRELENKKVFNALNDTFCNECRSPILESDQFYFMGEKEKICTSCYREIIEHLES